MKIVNRNGIETIFDIDKIVEAVSKAIIRDAEERVDEDIALLELFYGAGEIEESNVYYGVCNYILREYRKLKAIKQCLRALHKAKTERISAIIRVFWMNRNKSAGRSSTDTVTDQMLLSMPTPPTSVAAMCSYRSGGAVVALAG